jgi:hypothetical protein
MTIELRIAKNNDAEEWDSLISQSSHGTIFHMWNWLKITEKYTDTKLYALIGTKNDIPIGIFPLFFQKKGPVRMVFSPPPHAVLPYLGPVLAGYDALKQEKRENIFFNFQNSVEKFIINNLNAQYTSISLPPGLQDPRPFSWSGYLVEPNYDYEVDVTIGMDNLNKSLDRKQRSDLKRARERGMVVEIGTKKDFEIILNLLDIRYAEQAKIITASKKYLLDVYDAFKENIKIFVVKVDGEVLTGSIDIQYKDTLYCWIGNPKPKNPISPSPNDILINDMVKYASENAFKCYTTFGAAGDKRLHKYYASRFDPELKIRYNVLKKSYISGVLETAYTNILKPLRGTVENIKFKKNESIIRSSD